jgi:hypothetical protein
MQSWCGGELVFLALLWYNLNIKSQIKIMKKKKKLNIKPEMAWGIIGTVALIFLYVIVSVSLNMPKVVKDQINQAPPAESQPEAKKPINEARVLFAKSGQKEVYKVQNADGKWVVIIDDWESAAYDDVGNATFSQDGEHFAFSGRSGEETEVVVDKVVQAKKFKTVMEISFSPDGSQFVVVGVDENGRQVTIINGQEVTGGSQTPPPGDTSGGSSGTSGTSGSGSTSSKKYKGNRFKNDIDRSGSSGTAPLTCADGSCNF